MLIEKNKSLRDYNTFGINAMARAFVSIKSTEELNALLKSYSPRDLFILGGGSNILLTTSVDKLVVHINLKGISIISESDDTVEIEVQAGENWHEFVMFCIENDFGGVENLSLIPGNTGTAPIQNIGAYGVELKDVFVCCSAVHMKTRETKEFSRTDCQFDYRDSVFKKSLKGQYIITSVRFRLTKKNHTLRTSYGAISDILSERNIESPTIRDVSDAVIAIRRSKLPDPDELGNSGSFFKNPILGKEAFKTFHEKFPEAPFYEVSPSAFKVPAGWLIEQAGFKGRRYGDAGIHEKQALVLVNFGGASGKEILDVARRIQKRVKVLFGIDIEPEVNVI